MGLPPELQQALLGRRVVFLRGQLDEANANNVIAQLLLLSRTMPGQIVELYVDSPGGTPGAALALYDILQTAGAPVSTTCIGTAGGAAVLVLAGGAPGLRFALPHARVHLSDDAVDLAAGRADDLASRADEAARLRDRWRLALVRHSGHSVAQLQRDLAAGGWLSAADARDYGLVDGIVPGRPA